MSLSDISVLTNFLDNHPDTMDYTCINGYPGRYLIYDDLMVMLHNCDDRIAFVVLTKDKMRSSFTSTIKLRNEFKKHELTTGIIFDMTDDVMHGREVIVHDQDHINKIKLWAMS